MSADPGRRGRLGRVPQRPPAAVPAGVPASAPTAFATGAEPGRPRLRSWLVAIVGALVLPVIVAAGLSYSAATTDLFAQKAADARLVSEAELEAEYGIRVNLVAVTAGGGLIDLRFTVLDGDKASHVLHDADTLPQLLVASSGAVLRAPQPRAHKLNVVDGAHYFLLFPNAGGAIQAGTPVSVVIDEIRLAPRIAES